MEISFSEIDDWTDQDYQFLGWPFRIHVPFNGNWTDLHPNVSRHPWARLGGRFDTNDEARISPAPQLEEWCSRHKTEVYVRIGGSSISYSFPTKAAALAFRLCL